MKTPGAIIWPEPNKQQFNVRTTDPFFTVNVAMITPTVVDENRQFPSFTLTAVGAILLGPNSLKATDGDIVIGSVLAAMSP